MKYYFKFKEDSGGGLWYIPQLKIWMRLAGKPKFLLKKYVEKYWKEWGPKLYQELLDMFSEIHSEWYSPFVLYYKEASNGKDKKEGTNFN